jgi:diaminopimelate epimerase
MPGRAFLKMTGSGNDFVFFDARETPAPELGTTARIRAICARGTGVGADGIVFVESSPDPAVDAAIRYVNADGSPASLCGNATLCAVRLLSEGSAPRELSILTGTGLVTGRIRGGVPEIDLDPAGSVTPDLSMDVPLSRGERALGFALAGVPHLVVLVDDLAAVDVAGRGAALRRHPALGAAGANVSFVAPNGGGSWIIRTFERGVEGETLACGTGVVAAANIVSAWDQAGGRDALAFHTRSGSVLRVRLTADHASLSGEGRIVFRGVLEDG